MAPTSPQRPPPRAVAAATNRHTATEASLPLLPHWAFLWSVSVKARPLRAEGTAGRPHPPWGESAARRIGEPPRRQRTAARALRGFSPSLSFSPQCWGFVPGRFSLLQWSRPAAPGSGACSGCPLGAAGWALLPSGLSRCLCSPVTSPCLLSAASLGLKSILASPDNVSACPLQRDPCGSVPPRSVWATVGRRALSGPGLGFVFC